MIVCWRSPAGAKAERKSVDHAVHRVVQAVLDVLVGRHRPRRGRSKLDPLPVVQVDMHPVRPRAALRPLPVQAA